MDMQHQFKRQKRMTYSSLYYIPAANYSFTLGGEVFNIILHFPNAKNRFFTLGQSTLLIHMFIMNLLECCYNFFWSTANSQFLMLKLTKHSDYLYNNHENKPSVIF